MSTETITVDKSLKKDITHNLISSDFIGDLLNFLQT